MKIVVIGDAMLDRDIYVTADRLCNEAPIPVFRQESIIERPGGAANVAMMCAALGADTYLMCSCGDDKNTEKLRSLLCKDVCIHADYNRSKMSTVKTRIIDIRDNMYRLVCRVDQDSFIKIQDETVDTWVRIIDKLEPDAVVVCDHGKGVITNYMIDKLATFAKKLHLFIDPIKTTPVCSCDAVWVGNKDELPQEAALLSGIVIEKMGKDGIDLSLTAHVKSRYHLPSCCDTPVDSLGCGDQFISALAVEVCKGVDWLTSCKTANYVAGLQAFRRGIIPITLKDIEYSTSSSCSSSSSSTREF